MGIKGREVGLRTGVWMISCGEAEAAAAKDFGWCIFPEDLDFSQIDHCDPKKNDNGAGRLAGASGAFSHGSAK